MVIEADVVITVVITVVMEVVDPIEEVVITEVIGATEDTLALEVQAVGTLTPGSIPIITM